MKALPSSWLDVEVGSQMPGTKISDLHFKTPRIGQLNMTNYRSVILIRRPDRSALVVLVVWGASDSPLEVVICKGSVLVYWQNLGHTFSKEDQ